MTEVSNNEVSGFSIQSLDLSGISAEDIAPKERAKYIVEPGIYNLTVIGHKITKKIEKDGAGNRWGSILLKLQDQESGRLLQDFVTVPMDSLIYTSKSGKTSKVKAQQFVRFMSSIMGRDVKLNELGGLINDLSTNLENATLRASIGYTKDTVRFAEQTESGDATYKIVLIDGGEMLGADGEALRFSSRDAAVEYYKQIKNFAPALGLNVKNYLTNRSNEVAA